MSQLGQTEKNSVGAYVFRFALELGHCPTQSACLKRASSARLLSRRADACWLGADAPERPHRDGHALVWHLEQRASEPFRVEWPEGERSAHGRLRRELRI